MSFDIGDPAARTVVAHEEPGSFAIVGRETLAHALAGKSRVSGETGEHLVKVGGDAVINGKKLWGSFATGRAD